MIKVGVADYGLNCWYGANYDYRDRFALLKETGFDGLERLEAKNADEAMQIAADARREGLGFGTCLAGTVMESLRYTAALGYSYMWTDPTPLANQNPLDVFCRKVNYQIEAAAHYGVKVGIHNHLGLLIEKEEQLDDFLVRCPGAGIVFDVGHMAGAGGDPMRVLERYFDRIVAVHMKDYVYKDKNAEVWHQRLRFCELGAGEMGELNLDLLKALKKKDYNGWIFVEHDTHLQDPKLDLAISREFMRRAGI